MALTQQGVYEKLSIAETLAGITFRAAAALNLSDRGILAQGKKADMVFTDPPYGIDYEYKSFNDIKGNEYLKFCYILILS